MSAALIDRPPHVPEYLMQDFDYCIFPGAQTDVDPAWP
jgi:hypothetical protein